MKILVTGAAGFIGYHLSKKLLHLGHEVIGLDNINDYYDVGLKYDRLENLGIPKEKAEIFNSLFQDNTIFRSFRFIRLNLEDRDALPKLFKSEPIEVVCHMAAQAGVRYSLENPEAYIDSNIVGFLNVLECCRNNKIQHLVYASSSSVYGLNKKIPFEVTDSVDYPISIYAATKKSNELMAHTYSHLYNFATTGLRFFTVYGPWGRPDMAMFLFTEAIIGKKPIKVFNNGNMKRDFTFIDDIVEGVVRIIEKKTEERSRINQQYKIYNIGNNTPVRLLDFIEAIEKKIGVKAIKELAPMQQGDVAATWANIDSLKRDFDYSPDTTVEKGVAEFITWYKSYYNKE